MLPLTSAAPKLDSILSALVDDHERVMASPFVAADGEMVRAVVGAGK